MRTRLIAALSVCVAALPCTPTRSAAQSVGSAVPEPASVIGFAPGTDRKLPQWQQIVAYFHALQKASPRIQVHTLGKTTLGRPFIAAFIGDSATIANLTNYREMQLMLADPRLATANQIADVERDGKLVVLVTSSIHSTEVGGILTPMRARAQARRRRG